MKITFENIFYLGGKNEKQIYVWGGVLATLFLAILICFASCDNGSTSGGGTQNSQSSINYSLGDPPKSDPLPEDKYSIDEKISEGIYIEFDIPTSENYWTTRVYIEGLGPVAEEVQYTDQSKTRGCFYYPFVEAGKEYTIRFVFLRKEEQNEEGFVIDYKGDDGSIGWFETNVTAGSQSKGEVRFTSKGKIDVNKNGDFRFTEKPTFQNEYLLDRKWEVEIGLVEGVSWAHGAERRTKWREAVVIPLAKLTNTCNLFDLSTWPHGIDFVCVRPIMYYEHDGKTYKYQWDSFVQDIFYPSQTDSFVVIDISSNSQLSKIFGTWEFKTSWTSDDYQIYDSVVPMKVKQTKTLTIDAQNLEIKIIEILTKKDGSEFTEEQKKFHIDNPNRNTEISNENKTMTQQWIERYTLSEYLAGWENQNYTRHYKLKFFEDNYFRKGIAGYWLWKRQWA